MCVGSVGFAKNKSMDFAILEADHIADQRFLTYMVALFHNKNNCIQS